MITLPKKKDLIDYMGTILISLISFGGVFLPISIGFIEKRGENRQKKIILYGISVIIVILKFSLQTGIGYVINIVLLWTILGILTSLSVRNTKLLLNSIFLTTLVSHLVWSLFDGILAYDILSAIIISIATTMGYLLFNNFSFDFENIEERGFIILSALIGIAIASTGNLKIYFLEIGSVLSVYVILNLAYLKGVKFAVLSGLIIGIMGELAAPNMGVSIISLTLGGLIASFFSKGGKLKTIMGFILGNSILAYYITGYNTIISRFVEIIFAGLLFIISNKKISIVTNFIHDDVLLLSEGNIKSSTDTLKQLEETSNALSNMSGVIDGIEYDREEDEDIFDKIKNKICIDCKYKEKCWNENYDHTMDAIFSCIEELEERGEIKEEYFRKLLGFGFCTRGNRIINEILERYNEYKAYKGNITFTELKKCMVNQLKGISKYILNITTKVKEEDVRNIEEKIIKEFESVNIPLNKVNIDMSNKECAIELKTEKNILKNNIEKVNLILSKILKKRIINIDGNKNIFKEAERFKVILGIATLNAQNQKVSGDTYKLIDFYEDKYIMVLSDGMGVGERASYMSNLLVEMFSDMVKSDFDAETITTLISSFMQYISDSEKIITLDSTSVNLITGECEFIKIGGAPTFIIKKDCVDIICCNTLPMGILEEVDFYKEKRFLTAGDIIVSVTDGVVDSKRDVINKEFWVSGFLKGINIDEPQIIAEELLAKAVENYGSNILDDVTIIVQKIV